MDEVNYNINLDKLCSQFQLGDIIADPRPLTGGFLHRMFSVETTKGKYAIKALNPNIMLRPTAMKNYINSEKIARLASNFIQALPTKIIDHSYLHQVDNQYYMIFDWVDGICYKPAQLNEIHCEKMGFILAKLHNIDFSSLEIYNNLDTKELSDFKWKYYYQTGLKNNSDWVNILQSHIDKLYAWTLESKKAVSLLTKDMIISHRDLDPKNVLWVQDSPVVIDWESAGYVHPLQELVETAIYWSESDTNHFEKERFISFLKGYKKLPKKLEVDWKTVLSSGFYGKLEWLEYNLKRSLGLECTDIEEQQLGTDQVTYTIQALNQYENLMVDLEELLKEYL